jgi:SAM-dependent methyltransferase
MNLRDKIDNFFYNRILRPIFFTSRLGRKTMFGYADSGISFDHIYRNEAKGYTRIGKIVDRMLLDLPACKATRHRKETLIKILKKEIESNIFRNKKTRIADLASGPARYLVELITPETEKHVEVLCLDIDSRSLNYGKNMAGSRPMLYKKSNVLRLGSHHKHFAEKRKWQPNVIVVSGFYEYISNDLALHTLKAIKNLLEPGGLLLLVTQRDSPNRKLIEKLGITKSGREWVLFYREPDLIIKWMVDIGYKDIDVKVDPWQMYVFFQGRKPL